MTKKGISPLVAVIMLIAFTLIIAGILAGWATRFAETQSETLTVCLNSKVLLSRGTYNPSTETLNIFVVNMGKTDLVLTATLTYRNETRHLGGIVLMKEAFELSVEEGVGMFTIDDVTDDLQKIEIKSDICPGTTDRLLDFEIAGLRG